MYSIYDLILLFSRLFTIFPNHHSHYLRKSYSDIKKTMNNNPKLIETNDIKTLPNKSHYILINTYKGVEFINYLDILLLEADGLRTIIHKPLSKIIVNKSLMYFEFLTGVDNFIRITRSYIVNTDKITTIKSKNNTKRKEIHFENGFYFELKSPAKNQVLRDFLKRKYYFV